MSYLPGLQEAELTSGHQSTRWAVGCKAQGQADLACGLGEAGPAFLLSPPPVCGCKDSARDERAPRQYLLNEQAEGNTAKVKPRHPDRALAGHAGLG